MDQLFAEWLQMDHAYRPVADNKDYKLISPVQNCRHFGRRHFNYIFLNGNDRIPIQISLEYDPRGPSGIKPSLVQVMAWRRTGDKPLSEPMMTQFIDAHMRH